MKLAEALQERSDLNRNIEQLSGRLTSNALVQEGETTAEDPNELLKQLDTAVARLEELMARINLTNCKTLSDGVSITELIAKKDCLRLKLNTYKTLAYEASQTARRASRTEIKVMSAVDVRKLQKTVDKLSAELRQTDNAIQALNWNTELL